MWSGSRVNQSSPTEQEIRDLPLLEWSNNKREPRKQSRSQNTAESDCLWRERKKLQFDWQKECQLGHIKMQNGSHTPPTPPSFSTAAMWIPNHGILITTQKIINVGELLATPFPAWASCLGHSKVRVQDCLKALPSSVTNAGDTPFPLTLFHVFLFPVYCTFQDLQVLLRTFEDNASLLESGAQDRDNRASAASLQPALARIQCCKLQL